MKLSEKIQALRKREGLSQEALAEKLSVSRQAVSRWEMGTALPDALNILSLSRLFNVSADYLLNDDMENETCFYKSISKEEEGKEKNKKASRSKLISALISLTGLLGIFIIYLLSRFIKAMIPQITYENGTKFYTWGNLYGYSFKYFVEDHNLGLLVVIFIVLIVFGILHYFSLDKKLINILKDKNELSKK